MPAVHICPDFSFRLHTQHTVSLLDKVRFTRAGAFRARAEIENSICNMHFAFPFFLHVLKKRWILRLRILRSSVVSGGDEVWWVECYSLVEIHGIVADMEHTNKNMIRKDLINIGIQMFSRKRLANFFFLFLSINYATLFLVEDVWAQRKFRARTFRFDFHCIPFSFDWSLSWCFRLFFVYAFLRASSFFHPVSFYTITHAFTRTLSCHDLEKKNVPQTVVSIAVFFHIIHDIDKFVRTCKGGKLNFRQK